MTVHIQIDSSCTLTALSITLMTSLTEILLAHFVTNIAFGLSFNSCMQKGTECVAHVTVRFGF
jgi:hypothetical protein